MPMPNWPDVRVDFLRELVNDAAKYSCSEMRNLLNNQFSCNYSRNAIIGKIDRLGLKSQSGMKNGVEPKTAKRVAGSTIKPSPLPAGSVASKVLHKIKQVQKDREHPKPDPQPLRCDPVEPGRVTLLQLTKETCRWPIGTPGAPDFCFCGNPPIQGRPYCSGHTRISIRGIAA